jgi:hypothetical protein
VTEHQPLFLLLRSRRDLDRKPMDAILGSDRQRHFAKTGLGARIDGFGWRTGFCGRILGRSLGAAGDERNQRRRG